MQGSIPHPFLRREFFFVFVPNFEIHECVGAALSSLFSFYPVFTSEIGNARVAISMYKIYKTMNFTKKKKVSILRSSKQKI